MAKGLSLVLNGKESVFGLSSMDRAAVYGKRRRIALDSKVSRAFESRFLQTVQWHFDPA